MSRVVLLLAFGIAIALFLATSAALPSTVATLMQPMMPGGAPAATAASEMMRALSAMHRAALGCGLSTTPFRDLIEMRHLKSAVDVGFVDGMMAATTPRGDPISRTVSV